MTVIIEYISWLKNVTDINDARWKPEINICVFIVSTILSKTFLILRTTERDITINAHRSS